MAANIVTDNVRIGQFNNGNSITHLPVNFSSDPLYVLLINTTGDSIADATKRGYSFESDFNTNEVSGTGYTARGQALGSLSITQTSSVVTFTSANPSWTSSTITAYGTWMVSHQSTAATSPAVGYWTFGGSVASTSGTFTIQVSGSGWFQVSGG